MDVAKFMIRTWHTSVINAKNLGTVPVDAARHRYVLGVVVIIKLTSVVRALKDVRIVVKEVKVLLIIGHMTVNARCT